MKKSHSRQVVCNRSLRVHGGGSLVLYAPDVSEEQYLYLCYLVYFALCMGRYPSYCEVATGLRETKTRAIAVIRQLQAKGLVLPFDINERTLRLTERVQWVEVNTQAVAQNGEPHDRHDHRPQPLVRLEKAAQK